MPSSGRSVARPRWQRRNNRRTPVQPFSHLLSVRAAVGAGAICWPSIYMPRAYGGDFIRASRFAHDSVANITREIDGMTGGKAGHVAVPLEKSVAPLQFLGTAGGEQEAR